MISSKVTAFATIFSAQLPPSAVVLNGEKTEFGEISEDLPALDENWVRAAQQPLSWETSNSIDYDTHDEAALELWCKGQYWYFTRTALLDLWILPQDMSKGSWENYATAASKGEEKVLQQVPQLFRLRPTTVIKAAKTVLNELRLPPALLRKEPLLLAMDSERLVGAFNTICQTLPSFIDPIEACRDTPHLLATACIAWTPSSLSSDDGNDEKSTSSRNSMSTVDNIQLLQKSFDNEVSADDLHMKPFL